MSQKIKKKYFSLLDPDIQDFSQWKCHKKIKKKSSLLLDPFECFNQMYFEVANGNVTKIKKRLKYFITLFHPNVLRNSH